MGRWRERGQNEARQDERDGNLPLVWTDQVGVDLEAYCAADLDAQDEIDALARGWARGRAREILTADLLAGYREYMEERAEHTR